VRLLLDNGADIGEPTPEKWLATAQLYDAVTNGHEAVVRLLAGKGGGGIDLDRQRYTGRPRVGTRPWCGCS
jgi:hypothetical protein